MFKYVVELYLPSVNDTKQDSLASMRLDKFWSSPDDDLRKLPPNREAPHEHVKRSCYQSDFVWWGAIENFSLSLNSILDGWSSLRCQPTRSYQDLAPLSGFISNWSCTSSNRRRWKRIKRDILTHYPEPGITRPPIAISHICLSTACCSFCSAHL